LFAQLENVRKDIHIPLVMMGYLNPIMKFGFEEFCQACSRVGIDGIIIPDLPMDDYLLAYQSIVEKYGLHFIFLITPETSEARILEIDQHTDGFIYMVSSPAVTGVQQSFDQHYAYFSRLQQMPLKNPKLIGFGISNQSTLQTVNQYASGAIVGSAFIKLLTTCPDIEQAVDQLILQLNQD
jgi:tryptophan synthase alpha chain